MVPYSLGQGTMVMPLQDTSRGGKAGDERLTRGLRQVMYDALACKLLELAVSPLGAQLLAVVFLPLRKTCFTHPALVVPLVHSGVVSLLRWYLFSVLDQRSG